MFSAKNELFSRASSAQSAYQISRSLRFSASRSNYFARTPSVASNRTTWTWSGWIKLGSLTGGTLKTFFGCGDGTVSNTFQAYFDSGQALVLIAVNGGSTAMNKSTSAVFRDTSSWYHIVIAIDTTQATQANRARLYVNGVQITSFGTNTDPALNAQFIVNFTAQQTLSSVNNNSRTNYFDGFMAEVNFVDGQQLTPASFGIANTVTGVWQPIRYAGTYGTNGFYLNFSDNSALTTSSNVGLGKDFSGNNNFFATTNVSITAGATYDSMIDVPTFYADGVTGRGNYSTLNQLQNGLSILDGGNLDFNNGTIENCAYSSIGVSSGKWYAEVSFTALGTIAAVGVGLQGYNNLGFSPGGELYSYGYRPAALKYNNGTSASYGATWTTGDVIGIALDLSAGTITFYKNGVSQGVAYSGLPAGIYFFGVGSRSAAGSINFGQRPFSYTVPSGFSAINTQNLSTPSIENGSLYMAATRYNGSGAIATISNAAQGVSMQPDLVWIKSRSAATSHNLFDSLRGATNYISSDTTTVNTVSATSLTAFGSTGFTLGTDAGAIGVNVNAATYIAWQWKAGGTSSTNTSGSTTSTVNVNLTSDFSVVTYSGTTANATVGHGLGVAPNMIIIKRRNFTDSWAVYHSNVGSANTLILNSTNAAGAAPTYWNNTAPTSTVFSLGSATIVNASGSTYVAYCFAAVDGYSAFGVYTGTGTTNGPFVSTNMRPRWIMIKRTDGIGGSWAIYDTSRNPFNVVNAGLYANQSAAETTSSDLDITSTGFKIRGTATGLNASAGTYVYAAFAENPFKYALAR